jgi:hypothetical protein
MQSCLDVRVVFGYELESLRKGELSTQSGGKITHIFQLTGVSLQTLYIIVDKN